MNRCDFFLCGWLEIQVNTKIYPSVLQLKKALNTWSKLDLAVVESACVHSFKKRLALAIAQKGGPSEHLLCK